MYRIVTEELIDSGPGNQKQLSDAFATLADSVNVAMSEGFIAVGGVSVLQRVRPHGVQTILAQSMIQTEAIFKNNPAADSDTCLTPKTLGDLDPKIDDKSAADAASSKAATPTSKKKQVVAPGSPVEHSRI